MDSNNLKKEYTNGEVTVVWQSGKCIHSANCVRNNPAVFQPKEKPWIKIDGSSTDKIIETVQKCPSGALTFYKNLKSIISCSVYRTRIQMPIN
ncbi:(4Fe-4S)-binding protein [Flavobacterium sp.]|jgi:uncharacterized Fe-S cluster protein YjdI|uniref:(4Fe-4S)-binding protein n=1 Tax=Flavobacterium sp. TaxID=239 RepID=UPI0037C0EAC1